MVMVSLVSGSLIFLKGKRYNCEHYYRDVEVLGYINDPNISDKKLSRHYDFTKQAKLGTRNVGMVGQHMIEMCLIKYI